MLLFKYINHNINNDMGICIYICNYTHTSACNYIFTLSQPVLQVKVAFMLFIVWKMQKIQSLMKSMDDSAWTCAQKCNYMERRAWVKKAVVLINIYLYTYNYIHNYIFIYIYLHEYIDILYIYIYTYIYTCLYMYIYI